MNAAIERFGHRYAGHGRWVPRAHLYRGVPVESVALSWYVHFPGERPIHCSTRREARDTIRARLG